MVGEGVAAAVAVELGLDEGCLVEVLALLGVFIDPKVGEHLGDEVGHEAREDGVAGVLCGGGQDAEVEVFVDVELVGNLSLQGAPLVEAEVVDDQEENLLSAIEGREDARLEDVGAHQGALVAGPFEPSHVVFADELAEAQVGLLALHGEHLGHLAVGGCEVLLPVGQAAIDLGPVGEGGGVADLHTYLAEILLVGGLRHFGDNLALVDVLLQGQEYLRGVDGLDEVVGNLGADGLVHDVFLLALRDHDNGYGGQHLLDAGQGLEAADARHVLVEQDEVVGLLGTAFEGVETVGHGVNRVTFLFEEEDMGLQELYLVVNPKKFI